MFAKDPLIHFKKNKEKFDSKLAKKKCTNLLPFFYKKKNYFKLN